MPSNSRRERRRKKSTNPESTTQEPRWVIPLLLFLTSLASFILSSPTSDFSFLKRFWFDNKSYGTESNLRARRLANANAKRRMTLEEDSLSLSQNTYRMSSKRMMNIPKYVDKYHFDDCVGKTIEECQVIIDTVVQSMPETFNNQTTLHMSIRKMREQTDFSYYKVVLRTNTAGTKIYGIYDDGVVYYPWPWRVNGVDMEIGPWDCDEGGAMTPEECCSKIQQDVSYPDDNGNYIACFVEEPVGGPHNPERDDRAIVVTDGKGTVVRAPVAH
mmetsp:Transcript_30953/g.63180  ORF Transcript_30953/g.63180 Transcript_30953/m.63180 type:complete len:272 (-) Transcript_30953:375-1190(-)